MIILKCSKCQEQLEVDDAFAGGVCRCIHCGALSQVPLQTTKLDRKGRPTAPPPMANPVTQPAEGSEVVIAPTRRSTLSQKRQGTLAIVLLLISLVMAVSAVYLVLHYLRQNRTPDSASTASSSPAPNPIRRPTGPAVGGLPIEDSSIAYLLNVGSAMRDIRDLAQVVIAESAKSLGKTQFVVVPWCLGGSNKKPPTFPEAGLAPGGKIDDLTPWLDTPNSSIAAAPADAAEAGVSHGAASLVVITGADLDKTDVDHMLARVKNVTWMGLAIGPRSDEYDAYPQLLRLAGGNKARVRIIADSQLRSHLE